MKQSLPPRSAAAATLSVLVIVTIAISAARIVTDAVQESNAGDSKAFSQTLTFGGIAGGFILVLWGGIALTLIPSTRRKRFLAASFPDAIVVNGRWNTELKLLLSRRLGPGLSSPELRGTAFTLVADSVGISFWIGFGKPRKAAEIRWDEIRSIRTSAMALSPVRSVSTLELALADDKEFAQFALGSQAWLGAFPQNSASLGPTVAGLETLRGGAVPKY
jgi:hypothetical protein